MDTNARGAALIDVVVTAALTTILAAVAIPTVGGALEHERAALGAAFVSGQLQQARVDALRRGTAVALRFTQSNEVFSFQRFADGNGDGVLEQDIADGIDTAVGSAIRVADHVRDVEVRINQDVGDIGGGGQLPQGSDPVRIGRTALLSFSPEGSCSSGTIYVAGRRGPQWAVRVLGATGRMRRLVYEPRSRTWRP